MIFSDFQWFSVIFNDFHWFAKWFLAHFLAHFGSFCLILAHFHWFSLILHVFSLIFIDRSTKKAPALIGQEQGGRTIARSTSHGQGGNFHSTSTPLWKWKNYPLSVYGWTGNCPPPLLLPAQRWGFFCWTINEIQWKYV